MISNHVLSRITNTSFADENGEFCSINAEIGSTSAAVMEVDLAANSVVSTSSSIDIAEKGKN
jgi:hypothetical protein